MHFLNWSSRYSTALLHCGSSVHLSDIQKAGFFGLGRTMVGPFGISPRVPREVGCLHFIAQMFESRVAIQQQRRSDWQKKRDRAMQSIPRSTPRGQHLFRCSRILMQSPHCRQSEASTYLDCAQMRALRMETRLINIVQMQHQ